MPGCGGYRLGHWRVVGRYSRVVASKASDADRQQVYSCCCFAMRKCMCISPVHVVCRSLSNACMGACWAPEFCAGRPTAEFAVRCQQNAAAASKRRMRLWLLLPLLLCCRSLFVALYITHRYSQIVLRACRLTLATAVLPSSVKVVRKLPVYFTSPAEMFDQHPWQ